MSGQREQRDVGPVPVRVLYVDGDDGTAATVGERLEAADDRLRVSTVGTAAAATDRLDDERVDCLVSEYDLPDGDGIELLSEAAERHGRLPTVLYTANGSETVASEATTAGVDRYRPKGTIEESVGGLATDVLELIESRRHETALLDRMTDAFFALDEEWRFTYMNERGGEVIRQAAEVDRPVEGYLGRTIWEEIPAAVDTVFHEKYTEAMEEQRAVSFEEYYEPLGEWFDVRAYPSQEGLSVFFQQTTERREYEAELERRESTLRRLYRVTADKEMDFGAKLEELFAIGREELGAEYASLSRLEGEEYVFEHVQSAPDNDAISEGDTVPLSWTSCERAITTRETLSVGDISADPDLAERQGNVELGLDCYLGTPVVVDGEAMGTFCFYDTEPREGFSQWEVTLVELMGNWVSYERERLRHESELTRERNRLEEFASVVSHDLRNPLNVATTNLDLARGECDSEHLDTAEDALGRMEDIITDVLSLARLGQQVVETEPVGFGRLVELAWGTVSADGADLVVESDGTLVGDESRLQQLLENLLGNAVEHAGPGVTVRAGILESGDGFYVADDGPGIPAGEREEIFESGYSTRQDGTGFGLNIVAEIASAHGGRVEVTDSDAGGARFEVRGIETR